MVSSTFYVYEHWRTDRDECFYVGKGRAGRAYRMSNRNKFHQAVYSKVSREGFAVEVRIVASGLSEDAAFVLEVERISFWRSAGADLANSTCGGDGVSGLVMSPAARAKMRAAKVGKTLSPEHRAKIGASLKGKKLPPHVIEGLKKAAKTRTYSPETRKKMSEAAKNRPRGAVSEETREKIRQALLGRKHQTPRRWRRFKEANV